MKRKLLYILIAIPLVLVLTSVTVVCYRKYCSEQEAIQAYRDGMKPNRNPRNPFSPEGQLAHFDSLVSSPLITGRDNVIFNFRRADALLNLGREKESVDILEPLMKQVDTRVPDRLAWDVERALAIAYLRLGEKNNCIAGHSSASCIFPIKGSGVYTDPYASQKAIDLFEDLLSRDSSNLEARWLLNVAYMTLGEYPQRLPSQWLIPGLMSDTVSADIKPFQDMAGDLGINHFRSMAGGGIVDDFDNDGLLDIVTSSWSLDEPMHYFRNNGDGSFSDLTKSSGLAGLTGGLDIMQADYNNDGYTDILVLRGAWLGEFGKQPNTLLRNDGHNHFTDVTIESGLLSFHPTQAATWADFNNDGWLDLFIGNETSNPLYPHPSELYINDGSGHFTNVAREAGCERIAFMKGVTSADYNNDGWPDIFISDLAGHKILLKNKGVRSKIPQFVDVTREAGLDEKVTRSFPTWFWDYNNDGWPDLFVCGYNMLGMGLASSAAAEALNRHPVQDMNSMYLFRNNHDGTFTEVTRETGLDHPVFAMGSNFGDLDNDGWLDMYLGTGNPDFASLVPNRLFRNVSGEKFVDLTSAARVGNLQKGHEVCIADIDNDGDQDIFEEMGGAVKGDGYFNSLYINHQNRNNWIGIQLEGTRSNRSAIGARVTANFTEGGRKRSVFMDINSGGSFGANPLRKEIGLGQASMIDELIIKWPTSGLVQVFRHIRVNQFLKIKEEANEPEIMHLPVIQFKPGSAGNHMDMIDCSK